MFLQALGKYLNVKAELGEVEACYAYARAAIALCPLDDRARDPLPRTSGNSRISDRNLGGQDMSKCEIFQFAALHANSSERVRFLKTAEFFFRSSVDQLAAMPTRTLCRPVVLLLSFGWSRAWFKLHPDAISPAPSAEKIDFGKPDVFVPQKVKAIKRFKQVALLGSLGLLACRGSSGLDPTLKP